MVSLARWVCYGRRPPLGSHMDTLQQTDPFSRPAHSPPPGARHDRTSPLHTSEEMDSRCCTLICRAVGSIPVAPSLPRICSLISEQFRCGVSATQIMWVNHLASSHPLSLWSHNISIIMRHAARPLAFSDDPFASDHLQPSEPPGICSWTQLLHMPGPSTEPRGRRVTQSRAGFTWNTSGPGNHPSPRSTHRNKQWSSSLTNVTHSTLQLIGLHCWDSARLEASPARLQFCAFFFFS